MTKKALKVLLALTLCVCAMLLCGTTASSSWNKTRAIMNHTFFEERRRFLRRMS